MKVFVAVAVLAIVASTIAHPASKEQKEQQEKYDQIEKECKAESHVDEEVAKKAKCEGIFTDDAKLNDFLVCHFKKSHFVTDAGEYDAETIKKELALAYGEEAAEKATAECTKDKFANLKETVAHLAKCLHKTCPKDKHEHSPECAYVKHEEKKEHEEHKEEHKEDKH